MSDNTEMAPLKRAYLAALSARGREASDKAVQKYTNGARGPHAWRKVAEADVAKAIADLEQLVFQGDGGAAKTESRLQRMANAAYGHGDRSKPPKSFDELQREAWDRFNHPPGSRSD